MSEDSKDSSEYSTQPLAKAWPETALSQTQVEIAALSHRGNVRPINQDCLLVTRLERSMHTLETNLPAGFVPHQHNEILVVVIGDIKSKNSVWRGSVKDTLKDRDPNKIKKKVEKALSKMFKDFPPKPGQVRPL